MSSQLATWMAFSTAVSFHIQHYVIPQYGDVDAAPERNYDATDCVKQADRYLTRFGRSSRQGEELRDLLKAAHWIQKAYLRLTLAGHTLPVIPMPTAKLCEDEGCPQHGTDHICISTMPPLPPKQFIIGDNTMEEVFKPAGLTDMSDLQAVMDAVEKALLKNVHPDDAATHAVLLADHNAKRDAEDTEMIRIAVDATIRALGGDPDVFVAENGRTVLELVMSNIQLRFKLEEKNEPTFKVPPIPTHYAMRNPSSGFIFVKEYDLFQAQGGPTSEWGKAWKPIYDALTVEDARKMGEALIPKLASTTAPIVK